MYKFNLVLLLLFLHFSLLEAQKDSTVYYGRLNQDLSRPSKIIILPGGNLVWIGQWNDSAIIMKINPDGLELKRNTFITNSTSTNFFMRVRDIIVDDNHNIITASDCIGCTNKDSVERVILTKLDTNLRIINQKILNGKNAKNPFLYNPSLAKNGKHIVLIASQSADGSDFEDLHLAAINTNLDTIWTKSINSCVRCDYEQPVRISAAGSGFATFAYHAFTDSATLFHIDTTGLILWKQRSYTFSGVAGGAIIATKDNIIIGTGVRGLPSDPISYVAVILLYSIKDGTPRAAISLSDAFGDRTINSLAFAPDGHLLMGYRRAEFSFNGALLRSQILRLDMSGPSPKFIESIAIPNPTEDIGMAVVHAVPLNNNGSKIGAIGFQLPANRTFYFTNAQKTTVPIKLIHLKPEFDFLIYPNPVSANGKIQLVWQGAHDLKSKIEFRVQDISGKTLLIKTIKSNISEIQLLAILPGLYFAQINYQGRVMTKKIVVKE